MIVVRNLTILSPVLVSYAQPAWSPCSIDSRVQFISCAQASLRIRTPSPFFPTTMVGANRCIGCADAASRSAFSPACIERERQQCVCGEDPHSPWPLKIGGGQKKIWSRNEHTNSAKASEAAHRARWKSARSERMEGYAVQLLRDELSLQNKKSHKRLHHGCYAGMRIFYFPFSIWPSESQTTCMTSTFTPLLVRRNDKSADA